MLHKTFNSLGEYLPYAMLVEIRLTAYKDAGHAVRVDYHLVIQSASILAAEAEF